MGVDWKKLPFGVNNPFVNNAKFTFDMVDRKIARLVLTDADKERFSIPEDVVPKPKADKSMHLETVGFKFNASPFSFSFRDVNSPDEAFIDTTGQTLAFSDKYIQMDFKFPSRRLYGLGERMTSFQLGEGAYTMWGQGTNAVLDDGRGRHGLSGVHPFLMVQGAKSGDYVGVFFRNANA